MNAYAEDSIALLRRMVAIPSESGKEDAVADLILHTLRSWGLNCRREGRNVLALSRNFDASRPTLAMDAHIDTVPPAEGYTRDPYSPGDDPDMVCGLGSNDDGASVVSMAAAFRALEGEELPFNLMLVLNCEEETSGPSGSEFIYGQDGPSEVSTVKWVIVGEPTGMRAAISERGLLVLDGVARGVSGHAARDEGVNALYIALDDIAALRSFEFDRISPSMGKVRLSVTMMDCGTAHNVIPERCSFVVDIRPTEQYGSEEILSLLQERCRSTLTARSFAHRSSATPAGSPLMRTVESLGIETFSSPTTSNWMLLSGREAVKMGPGDSSRSHHADEYILCNEICDAVEKYITFVRNFYGNSVE